MVQCRIVAIGVRDCLDVLECRVLIQLLDDPRCNELEEMAKKKKI